MKRSTRVVIAQNTLAILGQGYYTSPRGQLISLNRALAQACEQTVLHHGPEMQSLPAPTQENNVSIEVTHESTFTALQRLSMDSTSLGCLNFASAKNPGGGFLSGAQAQEEAITRSSGLYPCLLSQPHYYEQNRENSSCLYLDLLIASPRVPFFRTDEGDLIEDPFLVTIVTAPAPNAGAVIQNEPQRASEIAPCLQHRAELVLRAFALAGVDTLVLGAWGCGVFHNNPHLVASTFANLIGPSGLYAKHFKKIVFAIFDPFEQGENLRAFKKVFSA